MKTSLFKGFLFALLFVFQIGLVRAQCLNGNLENGNLTGWNTWFGGYATANQNMTPGVFDPGNNAIGRSVEVVDASVVPPYNWDPVLGFQQLAAQIEGSRSLRIGDLQAQGSALPNSAMASYTFTVTQSNKDFKFWYAVVMANGGHVDWEQPDFSWFMKLGPGTTTNSSIPTSAADPSFQIIVVR